MKKAMAAEDFTYLMQPCNICRKKVSPITGTGKFCEGCGLFHCYGCVDTHLKSGCHKSMMSLNFSPWRVRSALVMKTE